MSAINTENILTNYPVAGQDNDSQGFRDNFSAIKAGLDVAKVEITSLETESANTQIPNDFNSLKQEDMNIHRSTFSYFESGGITSAHTVDYNNGHYQLLRLTGDTAVTLSGWPDIPEGDYEEDGRVSELHLVLLSEDGSSHNVTFQNVITTVAIKKNSSFPGTVTVSSTTNPTIIRFFTWDNQQVYAEYKGSFA